MARINGPADGTYRANNNAVAVEKAKLPKYDGTEHLATY